MLRMALPLHPSITQLESVCKHTVVSFPITPRPLNCVRVPNPSQLDPQMLGMVPHIIRHTYRLTRGGMINRKEQPVLHINPSPQSHSEIVDVVIRPVEKK